MTHHRQAMCRPGRGRGGHQSIKRELREKPTLVGGQGSKETTIKEVEHCNPPGPQALCANFASLRAQCICRIASLLFWEMHDWHTLNPGDHDAEEVQVQGSRQKNDDPTLILNSHKKGASSCSTIISPMRDGGGWNDNGNGSRTDLPKFAPTAAQSTPGAAMSAPQ